MMLIRVLWGAPELLLSGLQLVNCEWSTPPEYSQGIARMSTNSSTLSSLQYADGGIISISEGRMLTRMTRRSLLAARRDTVHVLHAQCPNNGQGP